MTCAGAASRQQCEVVRLSRCGGLHAVPARTRQATWARQHSREYDLGVMAYGTGLRAALGWYGSMEPMKTVFSMHAWVTSAHVNLSIHHMLFRHAASTLSKGTIQL